VSALEMPEAPVQPGWDRPDTPYRPPVCIEWHSERLGNRRRVWIFTTGDASPDARWRCCSTGSSGPKACRSGRAGALTARQTAACGLSADRCDRHRAPQRELPCNPDFWLAVQEELLR
jgi:enterochelin esterase family protein